MFLNYLLRLEQSKQELLNRGMHPDEAERRVEAAQVRFRYEVESAKDEAMYDAVSSGVSNMDEKFLQELVRPSDHDFEVKTLTSKTDFSISPWDMKAGLLRNAKVSKDGTRYKVIPVGAKSQDEQQLNIPWSIEDVQKMTAEILKTQFANRRRKLGLKNPKQEFRTVTDKQPPDSWVHPGMDRDYTERLDQINDGLKMRIQQIFDNIYHDLLGTEWLFSEKDYAPSVPTMESMSKADAQAWYERHGFEVRSKLTAHLFREQLRQRKLNQPNSLKDEDEEE